MTSYALAMDVKSGFNGIPWGTECAKAFVGETWRPYRAFPVWDKKGQFLRLSFDEKDAARTPYALRHNPDEKTKFANFNLRSIHYGCGKTTGKFTFVVLRYTITSKDGIEARAEKMLGKPSRATSSGKIWDLPDLVVHCDQNTMLIFAKKYREPETGPDQQ